MGELVAAIDAGRELARHRERDDLTETLDVVEERIRSRTVTVAVVGEFKRGKSTLVNALIQTAACPVDADIVTAVPTLVRYGEHVRAVARRQESSDTAPVAEEVPLAELAQLVSESSDPRVADVHTVEVTVPHRILRSGLCLLDTPGVGGLDSAHGQMTLGSLSGADGMLFVTDASQELTGPELEFLQTAIRRCPVAALVVTKTDLHLHWRRIVELDRQHLARAGLDLPMFAVSSFLRLRARRQPELNAESGFAPLVEFLARDVVLHSTERAAADVAHEVDFIASQLAHETDTERIAVTTPEKAPELVAKLEAANERNRRLAAPSATWQQTLSDGIQDLVADVEHDLQARLRSLVQQVRDLIDASDPRETWSETEAWLRREVAAAGVTNRDLLLQRAAELSESVARQFDLEAGQGLEVEFDDVAQTLADLHLPSAASFSMPGGRFGSLIVTARTSALVPMMIWSVGVTLGVMAPLLAPLAVGSGVAIGGKLFRDEGKRQLSYRQAQAKAAALKFVDEVGFEMNKNTHDGLRRTQRRLRDEFQARAAVMHASTQAALSAVQRAATLDRSAQLAREAALDSEQRRLTEIRASMAALAGSREATSAR